MIHISFLCRNKFLILGILYLHRIYGSNYTTDQKYLEQKYLEYTVNKIFLAKNCVMRPGSKCVNSDDQS